MDYMDGLKEIMKKFGFEYALDMHDIGGHSEDDMWIDWKRQIILIIDYHFSTVAKGSVSAEELKCIEGMFKDYLERLKKEDE